MKYIFNFRKIRKCWDYLQAHPLLSILDIYIIKKFLGTFFFSLLLIISIVIVFDFSEHVDKFTLHHAPMTQVFTVYYLNFIPNFYNLCSALFVFISVIFFTSKLADNSEIIAMRASGMSKSRLLKPYMVSATIIAILTILLGAYIIPKSNIIRTNFYEKYVSNNNVYVIENAQLQVEDGVVAYISSFNNNTKQGHNFSLDKFENKRLVSHLTAYTIQYDTLSETRYHWKLYNYNIREMKGMTEKITSGNELDSIINMEPSDIFYTKNQQETMTMSEIKEYIEKQKKRGSANVSVFEVEYYKRIANAFAAFILTIIGVSLSCQKKKGGMGLSLGIGLALSFGYIFLQTISATFATNQGLPPLLAVWIPNIIFIGVAWYLYRKTPK